MSAQNKPHEGAYFASVNKADYAVEYRLAATVVVATEAGDEKDPDNPFAAVVAIVTTTAVVAAKETATTIVIAATAV